MITVRSRLEVLVPDSEGNYYELFEIVPGPLMEMLRQGKVVIRNWQALAWDSPEKLAKRRSVDKRGAKGDEAYCRDVLGELAAHKNLLVLNDEAHHAWRVPAGKLKGVSKSEIEEATKWIGGLDRLHKARGILTAYDFSATPFTPSGKSNVEEDLFCHNCKSLIFFLSLKCKEINCLNLNVITSDLCARILSIRSALFSLSNSVLICLLFILILTISNFFFLFLNTSLVSSFIILFTNISFIEQYLNFTISFLECLVRI